MPVVKDIESIKRITVLYVAPNELPKELVMPPTARTLKEIINGPIKQFTYKLIKGISQ